MKNTNCAWLIAYGLGAAVLYRFTLGGMGRPVGGELQLTLYRVLCFIVLPTLAFWVTRGLVVPRRTCIRTIAILGGVLLYLGVPMLVPYTTWVALEYEQWRFNYFGESQIFSEAMKACAFAALSALVLRLLVPGPNVAPTDCS